MMFCYARVENPKSTGMWARYGMIEKEVTHPPAR